MKKTILAAGAMLVFSIPISAQQASSPDANAQNTAALEQKIRDLEDRVIALEGKLRTIESQQSAATPAQTPETKGQTPPAAEAQAGTQPTAPTVPAQPPSTATQAGIAGNGGAEPGHLGDRRLHWFSRRKHASTARDSATISFPGNARVGDWPAGHH